jgi:hypothetical protein
MKFSKRYHSAVTRMMQILFALPQLREFHQSLARYKRKTNDSQSLPKFTENAIPGLFGCGIGTKHYDPIKKIRSFGIVNSAPLTEK